MFGGFETVVDSGPSFQMSLKEHYVVLITGERSSLTETNKINGLSLFP